MAFGLAEDCRALIADLVPIAIARALKTYAGSGLSSRAIEWLAIGQRGQSSNAMFYRFSGIRPANMSNTNSPTLAHPYDGSDLRRCRLLMEQVPDFAGRIAEMADVSPVWAAIVLAWDDLCKTMDIENPGWPAGTGSCFQTTDKLVEIARSSTIPERVASSE